MEVLLRRDPRRTVGALLAARAATAHRRRRPVLGPRDRRSRRAGARHLRRLRLLPRRDDPAGAAARIGDDDFWQVLPHLGRRPTPAATARPRTSRRSPSRSVGRGPRRLLRRLAVHATRSRPTPPPTASPADETGSTSGRLRCRRCRRTRPELGPGDAEQEQPHPDRAHRWGVAEGEHRRAECHRHQGAERCDVPERDHDGHCDGEPEQAGTPVEGESACVRLAGDQLVDELSRPLLVGGRAARSRSRPRCPRRSREWRPGRCTPPRTGGSAPARPSRPDW